MASNSVNIHKLQQALNHLGHRVLYNTTQFYSEQQDRPVTLYVLKQAVWDSEKQKMRNVELFSSTSQIQIVLFLRDLYLETKGEPIPTDNETWNKAKQKYFDKIREKENM